MRENGLKKKNRGITLIALVVTIVILLILAGISINMLTGQNGILNRAQEAKEKTEETTNIEKIKLAIIEAQLTESTYEEAEQNNLQKTIDKYFKGEGAIVSSYRENSYTVSLNNKVYEIKDNSISELNVDLYINNSEELKRFRDDVNNGNTYEGKYILLTSNITLDIDEEWTPIGTYLPENTSVTDETNKPFKGIFDGQNYTIDGIKITSKDKGKGLFGLINGGVVKNVIIGDNCNIDASISFGSISGYLCNKGSIINCVNQSDLMANDTNFGGIVGTSTAECTIKKCKNTGILHGYSSSGGIVGNNLGNVLYCYNLNTIFSKNSAGGICAINRGVVKECYNLSNIESETSNVGGIVGATTENGYVESCYNIGNITGTGTNIGGIVGLLDGNAKLSNCYNVGKIVSNNNYGGGIVGYSESSNISNCYYLTNCVNGNDGIIVSGTEFKSEDEIKKIAYLLGTAFKEDINNINSGYPILNWQ